MLLAGTNTASSIIWLVVLIGMIILMLVLPSITQKKRMAAYQEMQSRLKAGDKVQTIGGIIGKIVRIKDANGIKTIFIETGDKNNKTIIEFNIDAISGVVEGINPSTTETNATTAELEAEVMAEAETINVGEEEPAEEQKAEEAPKKASKSKSKK